MTPQARAQAAIELLDEIIAAARDGGPAADTLIARYFSTRRYAGSKDRRGVRDLVYRAIRFSGERPASGRAALVGLARRDGAIASLFDGEPHAPRPIAADEPAADAGVVPEWLRGRLEGAIGRDALPALLDRAPLDVRVNRLKADRDALIGRFPDALPTPHMPDGIRFSGNVQVEGLPEWRDGLIEVQDEGSQIVAGVAGAEPGMTVIDLCAGAGGKTLALAAAMGDRGRLIACDVDRARLSRLMPRSRRAGITIAETRLLDPKREGQALADLKDKADIVLIDAPCSGTGTWRRNPEARWRLTPQRLAQLTQIQRRLLDIAATLARPGGRIHFIVCSLLPEEGRDQIERFLTDHPHWSGETIDPGAGRSNGFGYLLDPHHDGTDGFFVAAARRAC